MVAKEALEGDSSHTKQYNSRIQDVGYYSPEVRTCLNSSCPPSCSRDHLRVLSLIITLTYKSTTQVTLGCTVGSITPIDTAVECVKNTFALVASHFSKLALEHAATGVMADFNADRILGLAKQYHDVAESIVNDLDL